MAAPASPIPSYAENEPREGPSKGQRSEAPQKIKNVQMEIVGFEGLSVNLKKRVHQDYNKDVHESFVYTKVKVSNPQINRFSILIFNSCFSALK